jgi:hypothetical protein
MQGQGRSLPVATERSLILNHNALSRDGQGLALPLHWYGSVLSYKVKLKLM